MPRKRADDPQAAEPAPEVMLATEVADYLRVSYITVLKMTHAGELNAIRVGREFRYLRSEIDNLMRRPARDPHPQLDQPADAEV